MPEAAATGVAPGDLEAVNISPTSHSFVASGFLTAAVFLRHRQPRRTARGAFPAS
jgi:hypothetical protein